MTNTEFRANRCRCCRAAQSRSAGCGRPRIRACAIALRMHIARARRSSLKHAEAKDFRPLVGRPGREERRHGRAGKQRGESAASHSMTSSARPRTDDGIVRPSAAAVLRLTTNRTGSAARPAGRRVWPLSRSCQRGPRRVRNFVGTPVRKTTDRRFQRTRAAHRRQAIGIAPRAQPRGQILK